MTPRIELLQKFMEEDPDDPFNLYALALEYQKHDHQKALELFRTLTTDHPQYIPTYYHFGKLQAEFGDRINALKIFETGIEQARSQQDSKALRELQAAYQDLIDDE